VKVLLAIRAPSPHRRGSLSEYREDPPSDTTHVVPLANYVIGTPANYVSADLSNYPIGNPSDLANFMIADIR
jgi:hypothetical protein